MLISFRFLQVFLQVFFVFFNNFCNWLIINHEITKSIYEITSKKAQKLDVKIILPLFPKNICHGLGVERIFFYI